MRTIRVADEHSVVAPLGVAFADATTGARVFEGLEVVARRVDGASRPVSLRANASGVFVAQTVPGVPQFARGDDAYWASPPDPVAIRVFVSDARGNYLPFSFVVQAPHRGVYSIAAHPAVPLFSTPARVVAAPTAVVRGELWDGVGDRPAAGALVSAALGARALGTAWADDNGRFVLLFPQPEPVDFPEIEPPGALPTTRRALHDQQWSISFSAQFDAAVRVPASFPDVARALSQPPVRMFVDAARATVMPAQTLRFGRELVLRSTESGAAATRIVIAP